jgi:prolipoprotein diacylglyceryl transferase
MSRPAFQEKYNMILHWTTNPEIFRIGGFAIRYYSLLFVAGVSLSYFAAEKIFRRENRDIRELQSAAVYAIIGLFVGARLGHCLFYDFSYYSKHIWQIFIPVSYSADGLLITGYSGLASHGGVLGILISMILWKLRHRGSAIIPVMDILAITAPICAFFVRVGNFMNSEIIGKPTNSDWGIVFSRIDSLPRHPGQLYEACAYACIFIILLLLYRKTEIIQAKGRFFGLALLMVFPVRIIIELFKENQSSFESGMTFNMGQILSLPLLLVGAYFVIRSVKKEAAGGSSSQR